jgi:hypothetical protein
MINYSRVVASLLYLSDSEIYSSFLASITIVVTEGATSTILGIGLVTSRAIIDFEYILRTDTQSVMIAIFYSCRTSLRRLVYYK